MLRNHIYCGDAIDLLKNLPNEYIDLTVTSPPYDNLRSYNGYCFDFENIAKELYRVTKPGGVIVWVVSDATINGSETLTSFKQAIYFNDIGFKVHDTMLYQKINYIPLTHNRYEQAFEYMFVFSKGKPKTFNPIMIPCKNPGKVESYGTTRRSQLDKKQAMRCPEGIIYKTTKSEKIHPNIFKYTCGASHTGHPAVFPLQLAKDQVKSWSNVGDLVLDPFIGSGTTALACAELNRDYIGFDVSDEYCNIARERLKNVQMSFI